ncbi:CST complex subunit CTC1 isoform X2 [Melanotaenia boesemani]|uniref:CST complex subunit CTC1 isoform X2 n=1 Tax=Melanotaenia boesemani TaxID=1250792 RepID=UPI001C04ED1E|nr:CST complex subunit CTC1 isoform X2 [Melanotaenia boesemani]
MKRRRRKPGSGLKSFSATCLRFVPFFRNPVPEVFGVGLSWNQRLDSPAAVSGPVRTSSEAESLWMKNVFTFICQHLSPGSCGPASSCADQSSSDVCCNHSVYQLSVYVLQKIQEMCVAHSLPVSYRLLSISELVSQQHLACVSNLSWTTNQQRAWTKEAELCLPGERALPRVNLLLIGFLREGQGGEWRLTDSSGSVRCECLSPSPLWLSRPVFLPHWNYIPHDSSGHEKDGGCLELIGSPVLLCPDAGQGLVAGSGGGEGLSRAVDVTQAAGLLQKRVRGQCVSVYGQVGAVCPLLEMEGSTFFFFTLTDKTHSLPVLVKDNRLWWSSCVCVGQSVCVTSLRVCVLRGWRRNNILCVTEHSEIHTNFTPTHTQQQTQSDSQLDTPLLVMSQTDEVACEEAEPEEDTFQSGWKMKNSRVISYQGTVSEVVSEGAGLYVLDRKVGLCVAYQPAARRKLRAGDGVELHHVHFLYRPSPDFPPSMLCCCLHSSIRVTAFSRLGGTPPAPRCPGDGVLPRLLLQKNTGVSEYLWTCHLASQLSHSLLPGVLKQQCVCPLSWKLMETLWRRRGRRRRDIYSEMLDEVHTCPLTQYPADPAVHQYLSVFDLLQSLESSCWSSLSLKSLLPPDGSSLTRSQINSALSWSCRTLSSDPGTGDSLRLRPLLLVGVLQLPSQTSELKHVLHLRDATASVACIVTETSEEDDGRQTSFFNTAWIGCLVCVLRFTMVTERFLQSDFPSYQHLDQERFITHRRCRVYLQFSLDHLLILSPSAAMATYLKHKEEESGGDVTLKNPTEEEIIGRKRKREDDDSSSSSVTMATCTGGGDSRPCVSMVIRVEEKEGMTWKNTRPEEEEEVGLQLCFSVRAAVIGPLVSWGRDPKHVPMMDREVDIEKEEKVVLVFSGVSARWFPVLQPACFYRLVAANTQDPSVLIGSGVHGQSGVELHTDSTLQIRSDWRFHTLTRPPLLLTCRQVVSPHVLSVSEALDCSSEMLCVQGLLTERIHTQSEHTHTGTHSGVRLTLCDQTGRSLRVYLDLSHTPYLAGLLPGNTLLLSGFQRKLSRSGSVYCSYLHVSSITVMSLGDTSHAPPPPAPMMHLGPWSMSSEEQSIMGQSCRSRCGSSSSRFQSKAKLVVDDGTGEAHVWFSGVMVRHLLGLADSQWEGLQRALRTRGHIRVYPRGRGLVCDGGSDDPLLHFLLCVCSSDVVCRPIFITCRKHTNQKSEEVRRFSRGERDFLTRLTRPLQLTCVHLFTE